MVDYGFADKTSVIILNFTWSILDNGISTFT